MVFCNELEVNEVVPEFFAIEANAAELLPGSTRKPQGAISMLSLVGIHQCYAQPSPSLVSSSKQRCF